MSRVAFHTFGILRAPNGDPQVQGFFDRIESVFSAIEASAGFIDRDRRQPDGTYAWGPAATARFFDPERHGGAPATLSLWEDLESVYAMAYRGAHGEAFHLRRDWFLKPEWPTYVAWWVDDSHVPDRPEAAARLEHLHDHGPTAQAFNFKQPFAASGQSRTLDRALIDTRIAANDPS